MRKFDDIFANFSFTYKPIPVFGTLRSSNLYIKSFTFMLFEKFKPLFLEKKTFTHLFQ